MHGVKRLFGWMIPRFDRDRFKVSLVSLRKKDLSEETLDSLGIETTYLNRSKFDPRTLPALLDIVDRQHIDVLHLHGYGATTFGRMAGALRRIPTILHEHANLSDTPWFQKIADRCLEPFTDIAIAVSNSTAEFVLNARQVRPSKVKVVYLGVPLEEFSRERSVGEIAEAREEMGIRSGEQDSTSRKRTRTWSTRRRAWSPSGVRLVFSSSARVRCCLIFRPRPPRSAWAIDSSLPASGVTSHERCPPSISACFRRSGRERR